MKNNLYHNSGLVQIDLGYGMFQLGYKPSKKLFCIGSLTEGLGDVFNSGESAVIEFPKGREPFQVMPTPDEITDNQIKVIFGSYFVCTINWNK